MTFYSRKLRIYSKTNRNWRKQSYSLPTWKKVCLDIDVEENENGSRRILRGGHDFSDRIEEDERLKVPHGIAVAIGTIKQLETEKDQELLKKAKNIFNRLEIPYELHKLK